MATPAPGWRKAMPVSARIALLMPDTHAQFLLEQRPCSAPREDRQTGREGGLRNGRGDRAWTQGKVRYRATSSGSNRSVSGQTSAIFFSRWIESHMRPLSLGTSRK